MLDAPVSAGSVDAELEIVRRDLARPSRFGGRFADEEDGRAFAAELVRNARAATPATPARSPEEASVATRGMATRRDDWA
jgi:hypothetical protein